MVISLEIVVITDSEEVECKTVQSRSKMRFEQLPFKNAHNTCITPKSGS